MPMVDKAFQILRLTQVNMKGIDFSCATNVVALILWDNAIFL